MSEMLKVITTRSASKENESRDTRPSRDAEVSKPKRQPRANNNIDKEKVVKEEKVTERRQRRTNRKKIRVESADKVLIPPRN